MTSSASSAAFSARENGDLNQYWYSGVTIKALTSAALEACVSGSSSRSSGDGSGPHRVAFLSTPSLYFSLPAATRVGHSVLDIDTQWSKDPGFIRFDFNEDPTVALPPAALGAYDLVVIDPPFITEPVWRRYALAAHALLKGGAKGGVICTTVAENEGLLAELFVGCKSVPFQPSIPNLVYQYNTFTNVDPVPAALAVKNKEIPE